MRSRSRSFPRRAASLLLVAVLAGVGAGCSDDPSPDIEGLGSSLAEIQRLARREGALNLVVWPDYAHPSWARPFERETGCRVSAREGTTRSELLTQLEAGAWDGVSAPGTVSVGLMRGRDVAPLAVELVPNYEQVVGSLGEQPFASLDGRPYGVPHARAPNLLLLRTDAVTDDSESWGALWTAPRRLAPRLSLHDDPIAIADAALYLKAARPALEIDDPYALDERQFRAAVALVRRAAAKVGRYWTRDVAAHVEAFANGDTAAGTGWPVHADLLEPQGLPLAAVKPVEGTTGWSDAWLVRAEAEHPNCMYLWLDYVLSSTVQALIAERFHVAPVNLAACELTEDPGHCEELHADDEPWWADVHYWTAPGAECGDDRGRACVPLPDWELAWAEIRARR